MSRMKLTFPETVVFRTAFPIRITDVNYAGHVGNDRFLSLMHDARAQFFHANGWTELNIDGVGIVLADTVIVFKKELFFGDSVEIELSIGEPESYGVDLYYRLIHHGSGRDAAQAKTALLFFDYKTRKITPMPETFRHRFFSSSKTP